MAAERPNATLGEVTREALLEANAKQAEWIVDLQRDLAYANEERERLRLLVVEKDKRWIESLSAVSETAPLVAGDLAKQREIHDTYATVYAKVPSASMLAWASPDSFASYCISKGKKDQKSEWQIAWEIYRDAVGRSL